MKGIGVLVSGGGTNLQSVMDAITDGRIPAKINVVISDREEAYGLTRAKKQGIPAYFINKKDYKDHQNFNLAMLDILKKHEVDIIVLAGYLSILSKDFVEGYKNNIINIHPSLIPAFCGIGYYGKKVHQAVIDYGAKVTGATVHFVDEGADTGAIIMQKAIIVLQDDDAESLAKRVLEVEHELLPKALELLVLDKISIEGRRVIIK